jgi:hypothetical protein
MKRHSLFKHRTEKQKACLQLGFPDLKVIVFFKLKVWEKRLATEVTRNKLSWWLAFSVSHTFWATWLQDTCLNLPGIY